MKKSFKNSLEILSSQKSKLDSKNGLNTLIPEDETMPLVLEKLVFNLLLENKKLKERVEQLEKLIA